MRAFAQAVTGVTLTPPVDAIEQYLGLRPEPRSFHVLNDAEWAQRFPVESQDYLPGPQIALTTPEGDVFIKDGHEDAAVHELLHTVGFRPDGIDGMLNEGITQAVALDICSKMGVWARESYERAVNEFTDRILPKTGLGLQDFARSYARARDKGVFVRNIVKG